MVNRFLDFINAHHLLNSGDKVLLAVSGGIDSVVLTHLFKEADFNFAIAHCNFRLRGQESDGDEEFVKTLAKSFDVNFFVQSFDTKNYAANHHISTQMAARDLRYEWFDSLQKTHGFKYLATAHHLNDSFETALFNLTKGTGISGVRGMLPKSMMVVRPLLFSTRADIEKYAIDTRIAWREDSSNESVDYSRNLIRHEVVPVLKSINPSLEHTFIQTQQRLADTEEILKMHVDQFIANYVKSEGKTVFVSIEGMKSQNALVIEEVLKPYGFNYSQAKGILLAIRSNNTSGKRFLSEVYEANIDREYLIVSPKISSVLLDVDIDEGNREVYFDNYKLTLNTSSTPKKMLIGKNQASFDFDRLQFPLKLRKWALGDVFQPLGMKGKKKLSDFMIDEKIPLNLKERVCVIESASKIIWVVGWRIDDRFKVREDTKRIYNVVILPNDQSL